MNITNLSALLRPVDLPDSLGDLDADHLSLVPQNKLSNVTDTRTIPEYFDPFDYRVGMDFPERYPFREQKRRFRSQTHYFEGFGNETRLFAPDTPTTAVSNNRKTGIELVIK